MRISHIFNESTYNLTDLYIHYSLFLFTIYNTSILTTLYTTLLYNAGLRVSACLHDCLPLGVMMQINSHCVVDAVWHYPLYYHLSWHALEWQPAFL